jgi:hypothetical protein
MCISLKLYDAKCDCNVFYPDIPPKISVEYEHINEFRNLFGPEGITKFFGIRAQDSLKIIEEGLSQGVEGVIFDLLKNMQLLAKNGGKAIWIVE